MQFLGVGWQEIALIMVVALVVVGPERLPGVAYQVGKAVRTMQSYARAVRSEFSEEIGFIEEQYKTVKGEVTEASAALRQEQQKFATEMRNVTGDVQGSLQAVMKPGESAPEQLPAPVEPMQVYQPTAFDSAVLPAPPEVAAIAPPATPLVF